MTQKYKPHYKWYLSDLEKVEKNNLKVFSCFACGGGSTMGYKLAGMTVIGANEIDPEMAWHYKLNHNPRYYYLEDIRTFRKREDLPKELFNLDILDGSPPCSSFSMAGSRIDQIVIFPIITFMIIKFQIQLHLVIKMFFLKSQGILIVKKLN